MALPLNGTCKGANHLARVRPLGRHQGCEELQSRCGKNGCQCSQGIGARAIQKCTPDRDRRKAVFCSVSRVPPTTKDKMRSANLRSGIIKLLKQREITKKRIIEIHDSLASRVPQWDMTVSDVMLLDVETYYTITHDLLKLAQVLLPPLEAKRFKQEPTFKRILIIRNRLVRHAYDKPNGDPYSGFGWGVREGIQVKAGSSLPDLADIDPGFRLNDKDVEELLEKYGIRHLVFT